MSDVRLLLKEKADIETAMQRDLAPHIRAFAQQELDKVCKQIEEAREEWDRLFEPQKLDLLKQRVTELETSNAELLGALEYMLKQCDENKRNQTNFLGISQFARDKAIKAIQKEKGAGNE